jgi:hypothetical protein
MNEATAHELFDLADLAWAHGLENIDNEAVWTKYIALSNKLTELAFKMKEPHEDTQTP